MPIKKIILHTGMHKTGTTSIQKTLYANAKLIKKMGYLYPVKWGVNHGVILLSLFQKNKVNFSFKKRKIATKEAIAAYNKQNRKNLEKTLRASDEEVLIISGEAASSLAADEFEALKTYLQSLCGPNVQIDVFVYVREHLNWAASLCQQYICATPQKGVLMAEYIEQKAASGFFKWHLSQLFQVFNRANIHVYSFEDAITHKNGLVGHFLGNAGFTDDQIGQIPIKRANEARSTEVVEFAEYIHDREPWNYEGHNIARKKRDVNCLFKINGAKFTFTVEQKRKLLDLCQDDIKWLKANCNIDYTNIKIEENKSQELYSDETLRQFIEVFPNLTCTLQKMFLDFFRAKYDQTEDEKFKKLLTLVATTKKTHGIVSVFRKWFKR